MAGETNYHIVRGASARSTVSRTPNHTKAELPQEVAPERTKDSDATEQKKPEIKSPHKSLAGEVARKLATRAQNIHRDLKFSVDEETGDTVINVIDSITKEVVRRIPFDDYGENSPAGGLAGAIFKGEA